MRERFGSTKTIWLWTGRRHEKVVDCPVLEKLKVHEKGCWFGSSNQRVIPLHPAG